MTATLRRLGPAIALVIVTAACGGGESATTTTAPTTTAPPTSTTSSTTPATTTTVDRRPLAPLTAAPVEYPFGPAGFIDVSYAQDDPDRLVSVDPIEGSDLFYLATATGVEASGVGSGQMLVAATVENESGAVKETGTVLYTLGGSGWSVYAAVSGADLLAFLETTTDYLVKQPNGPVTAIPVVHTFDWAGGAARFEADVRVVNDAEAEVFAGSVACELTTEYMCTLTSDDGVLRPDDEGEAVEALQTDLETLGYFTDPIDGIYSETTAAAVSLFQRDYRLTQDGRAGPQTLGLLTEVAIGESDIVMATDLGVGDVPFGDPAATAIGDLAAIFGTPDDTTGWYTDACDGNQWNQATWRGFTAIFTDRDGTRRFDGWKVTDISNVPDWLYFAGGISPNWTWRNLERVGAEFEPAYGGVWYITDLGYNNGRFTAEPGDAPAADAAIAGFGTGTGAFVSC